MTIEVIFLAWVYAIAVDQSGILICFQKFCGHPPRKDNSTNGQSIFGLFEYLTETLDLQ